MNIEKVYLKIKIKIINIFFFLIEEKFNFAY